MNHMARMNHPRMPGPMSHIPGPDFNVSSARVAGKLRRVLQSTLGPARSSQSLLCPKIEVGKLFLSFHCTP